MTVHRVLLALLLLSSCFLPPVTPRAKLRVAAASVLANCISAGGTERECLRENAAWCKSRGLEQSCGADEYWPRILKTTR